MNRSLENLHQQFCTAINTHSYMGYVTSQPNTLKNSVTKDIRLHEVFKTARVQIKDDLKIRTGQDISKQISALQCLEKDGEIFYQRYEKATKSWTRVFLKGLIRFTPPYLKRFFPNFFSNNIKAAERKTKKEYENYQKFLKAQIDNLTKFQPTPKDDKVSLKIDDKLPKEDEKLPKTDGKNADSSKDAKDLKEKDPKKDDIISNDDILDPEQEDAIIDDQNESPYDDDFDPSLLDENDAEMQAFLLSQHQSSKNASPKNPKNPKDTKGKNPQGQKDPQANPLKNPKASLPQVGKGANIDPLKDALSKPLSTLSKEEIQKQDQDVINQFYASLTRNLQLLQDFPARPLSLKKYMLILSQLASAIQKFKVQHPQDAQKLLEDKTGLLPAAFALLTDTDMKFRGALMTHNYSEVSNLLQSIPAWQASFKEALDLQHKYIKFGISRALGANMIKLFVGDGKDESQGSEAALKNYRGKLILSFNDAGQAQNVLKELEATLGRVKDFRPCKIEIKIVDEKAFTAETCKQLLALSKAVSEIEIQGLQTLDFKTLALSEDEELEFVQCLHQFSFPDLKEIVLSTHPKDKWKASEFSSLLAFCPTMDLLKTVYGLCPTPQTIIIPPSLCQEEVLDLRGYAIEHIPHLLKQFVNLQSIDLNGLPITDVQLIQMINSGILANVKALNFDKCSALTTDILPELTSLKHLTMLNLPDLPAGKRDVKNLPKMENPFHIKLFYTSSKVTQKLCASLYTGPAAWATVYQIPLARAGVAEIFNSNQTVIGPKNVAYWLHNDDYKSLAPQAEVKRILADANAGINDDNLADFVKKFPKATLLSLYNCPNITHVGIQRLLKECPHIKILDLTGCSGINEQLFYADDIMPLIKNLNKIDITNTKVLPDIVDQLKDTTGLEKKIVFEETTLVISNDQLKDADDLEKILKTKNLSKFKSIDLTNCTNLTNEMLGKLLDHLTVDMWQQTKDGLMEENPHRLNLAVLNLSGCSNITDEAFQNPAKAPDQKPDFKGLEILDRIVIGGTQISPALANVYPQVVFQDVDQPIVIQIDPEEQLQQCLDYEQQKQLADSGDVDAQKKAQKLGGTFIHNRLVVELFSQNPNAFQIISQPIDIRAKEFNDFAISFAADDVPDPVNFYTHRDVLFSQTHFFIHGLRPGGLMSKVSGVAFSYRKSDYMQDAMDTLLGNKPIEELDLKTAGAICEPVGTNNYSLLKAYYNKLLERIRSHFDLKNAAEMVILAKELQDTVGLKLYEDFLLKQLDVCLKDFYGNRKLFNHLAAIAKNGFKTLDAKIKKKQDEENQEIARQMQLEDEIKNQKLAQDLVAQGKIT